jgi:hypothetical protein
MLCKVYFGLHFYLVRLVILREQPCTYLCFFYQRTTTPQFIPKIELATLYTFDLQ